MQISTIKYYYSTLLLLHNNKTAQVDLWFRVFVTSQLGVSVLGLNHRESGTVKVCIQSCRISTHVEIGT